MRDFSIIIGVYIVAYLVYIRYKKWKIKRQYGLTIDDKANYKKIFIPIEDLQIKTNDYYSEEERGGLIDAQILDALLSKDKGVDIKHRHISIIQYSKQNQGSRILYNSKPVYLSEVEIRERIKKQDGIFFYYDENDPSIYQFDLKFLF